MNFTQIPNNLRNPLVYVETNASNANANAQSNTKILLFGQMLPAGTALPNVPLLLSNYKEAVGSVGQGSMLANMLEILFKNDTFSEKWIVPLADDGAGTAATGTITITGPATASGTVSLYMGGVLVSASVANTDTATQVATAIKNAINANPDLPITADNTAGVVTVTYRHKGTVGNYYDMRLNYVGTVGGEILPAGLAAVIVQLSGGGTDPSVSAAIAAIPSDIYGFWAMPYNGSTAITAFEDEMNSRWSPLKMLEGHVFGATAGSFGTVSTFGQTNNNEHMSIIDAGFKSPSPSYLWAAAFVGQVATSASVDPSRPFGTLPLVGILPSNVEDRRLMEDKNTLLYDGITTHNVTRSGEVEIERAITCYQENSYGVADDSWLDLTTPLTVSALRQSARSRLTTKYSRMKIADDGIRQVGAGSGIATPSMMRSEMVALAGEWIEKGWMEDMDGFKRSLIVQRNITDPTRMDIACTPNLVNPLNILAVQINFTL